MKKVLAIFSVIALMFLGIPRVMADEFYGTWSANCTGWKQQADGSKLETCVYSLTPKTAVKYVYLEIAPTNVSIDDYMNSANFKVIKTEAQDNGRVRYLLQAVNANGAAAGTKVDVITVHGHLIDVNSDVCNMSYAPLSLSCYATDNKYFNDKGEEVTAEEYNKVCNGVTPTPTPDDPNDVPNSDTGSVVPYVAIGGGLLAIAGVYLYSRKANKMYKI